MAKYEIRKYEYNNYTDEKAITPEMVVTARNNANLTQKESAALVYVEERTWQHWEAGTRKMGRNVYELFLIKTGALF